MSEVEKVRSLAPFGASFMSTGIKEETDEDEITELYKVYVAEAERRIKQYDDEIKSINKSYEKMQDLIQKQPKGTVLRAYAETLLKKIKIIKLYVEQSRREATANLNIMQLKWDS